MKDLCHLHMRCVTRRQTLRSLPVSYQKKDGHAWVFWLHRSFSLKVGAIPKEGWARPYTLLRHNESCCSALCVLVYWCTFCSRSLDTFFLDISGKCVFPSLFDGIYISCNTNLKMCKVTGLVFYLLNGVQSLKKVTRILMYPTQIPTCFTINIYIFSRLNTLFTHNSQICVTPKEDFIFTCRISF